MSRNKKLKKYLILYALSLETIMLTGCSKHEYYQNNNSEIEEDFDIGSNSSSKSGSSDVSNNHIKEKVSDQCKKIEYQLKEIDLEKIKEKVAKKFITLVEFIAGNEPINGIYFYELDDKTKQEIQKMVQNIDGKIEQKYPNYKDPWKEKYQSVQEYIKDHELDQKWKNKKEQATDKIDQITKNAKKQTKEIVGDENYNKIQEAKDDIKKKVKKGKQKVKDWYSDLKKKYN